MAAKAPGRSAARRAGARQPRQGAGADPGRPRLDPPAGARTSPGTSLAEDAELTLAGRDHPWVSRGGVKAGLRPRPFRDRPVRCGSRSIIGAIDRRLLPTCCWPRERRGFARSMSDAASSPGNCARDPRVVVHEAVNARLSVAGRDCRADRPRHLRCQLYRPRDASCRPAGHWPPSARAGRAGQTAIPGRAETRRR